MITLLSACPVLILQLLSFFERLPCSLGKCSPSESMPQTKLNVAKNQCASRPLSLKKHPSLKRQCALKTLLRSSSAPDKATSTIGSIDSLLGSQDEVQQGAEQQSQAPPIQLLRVPGWAWSELREPRVVPAASNVLYYLLLIVYTSYYVVQLAEGQEVADDLLARLVNDHAAVASGDTLRLFTSFFVADSIPQLIIALVGLATVVAELESLLGYSTFWAVWCVTVLAGSLADAGLSELPITAGPAAGVGGAAAALLAHHLHNWRIEQLLAQAKSGQVPEPFMQLQHQYNRQQRLAAAGAGADDADGSSSPCNGCAEQEQQPQKQHRWGGAIAHDDAFLETELEGPVGMSINLMLPREGKAFATLGGTAVAVVSALKDAADTDAATDWTALVAAFLVGGVLGWLACPVYNIKLVAANLSDRPDAGRRSMASYDEQQESSTAPADLLLPVLYDVRPGAERANAVVGAAALLFAAVGIWLTSQGLFV